MGYAVDQNKALSTRFEAYETQMVANQANLRTSFHSELQQQAESIKRVLQLLNQDNETCQS